MLKPSVQVRDEGGILVAEFWDCLRLDPAPVRELRGHFEVHLGRGGRPDVVLDLLGVGFAGSAALGGFLALNRLARSKGGRLVFCNVDPTVREVFRVSNLEPLFTFVADRPAALGLLAGAEDGHGDGTVPPPAPPPPATHAGPGAPAPLRRRRSGAD